MIEFGIHCTFFIVLHIRQKSCKSNIFFTRQKVHARKIEHVSEVLRATGIGRAICPGLSLRRFGFGGGGLACDV